jgi:hypothetical protein
MKKTGSAVNRAIKQTKAAMSILLPQRFKDRAVLTHHTRASGQKFNRVHRIPPPEVDATRLLAGGGYRCVRHHQH